MVLVGAAGAGAGSAVVPVRAVNPTRQRVLAAALALFNERGTAHVTTNHIAAGASLSPGNLYYWFRNKQEIIRALVQQWMDDVDRHLAEAHDQPAHVHALWEDLGRSADVERRYEFVRREILALIHDDAGLAEIYRATYRRRVSAQVAYLRRLVAAGILVTPEAPRTLEDLVIALWLVAEHWPTHHALMSTVADVRSQESGVRPLLTVLGPYLTDHGRRALEAL